MITGMHRIAGAFDAAEVAVVYAGDCLDLLRTIPSGAIKLVVTSPPYHDGGGRRGRC
jgi:DNA modification methylase